MRPDVKHDNSLTWDLLVARPLSFSISDENKKLSVWKKETTLRFLWFFVKFSFPPFIMFCFLPWFANPNCLSFCLFILHSCFPSFYLLLRSGSDDVKSKASASLQWLLAASVCQRPWNAGRVTLTQSRVACRDQDLETSGCCGETQHNHSRTSPIQRRDGGLV